MQRSLMRELAFKLIYDIEMQKDDQDEQVELFLENNSITNKETVEYLKNIISGLKEHEDEINHLIENNLKMTSHLK